MEDMDIRIDRTKRDDKYYNKDTFEVGDSNNIIKFDNIDNDTPNDIIAEIIAANLDLNKEEVNLLKVIYDNEIEYKISAIYNIYNNIFNKSYSTFNRALNKLVRRGVITITKDKGLFITKNYYIDNKKDIKYIIIKV